MESICLLGMDGKRRISFIEINQELIKMLDIDYQEVVENK